MAINFNPLDILSGFNLTKLNQNFQNIKTALTDGLSRSGNGPNQMEADIDLNSNDLLNVGIANVSELRIGGEVVTPDQLETIPPSVMLKTTYDPQGVESDLFDRAWNVKWSGAVGDGITDDTAAIQAALDAHPVVYMPEGVYIQTIALGLPSNTTLFGDGVGKTILKFKDGADKVHHSIVSSNATNLAARICTDANVDALVGPYVEHSNLFDFTIDANTYNRVKTYVDREQGTALELHKCNHITVQRLEVLRGPQHCINVRAGTNSFFKGYSYVEKYPSRFIRILDCVVNDQEIDDGITTHDSEYIWIERCNVHLDRAANNLSFLTSSNGIEIDDGSRYVWVNDCYVKNSFGGYQAKGHEQTVPAHHVWFNNCIAEDVHHGFLLSAVNSTTTIATPDEIIGTCHDIFLTGCTVRNCYNFVNASTWTHQSHYIQLDSTRHVTINNFTIVGSDSPAEPNLDPAPGNVFLRLRDNNAHLSINGMHFSNVERVQATVGNGLIQAESTNQDLTIRNITVDQYTKGPLFLSAMAGVNCKFDDIKLLAGSASYAVIQLNGVGGGTLRANNISGPTSLAPILSATTQITAQVNRDFGHRVTNAETSYLRQLAGLAPANVTLMQGAELGLSMSYSVDGVATRMGAFTVTPNNASAVNGTAVTTRAGVRARKAGDSDATTVMWMQHGSVYPNTSDTEQLGQSTRLWSKIWGTNVGLFPPASVTPTNNGEVSFQLTSNTSLTFKVRGSDGVVRSGSVALA